MYRIKLTSGQEAVYNSIDALAVAVRSGEVTGDALIYHRRAERWLAINTHPHYQSIQARQGGASQSAVTPEATSARAVENRDAAIQEKVKRLREMQRPIARPRPAVDVERPAPPEPIAAAPPMIEPESVPAPVPLSDEPIIAPPPVDVTPSAPAPAPAPEADDIWKSLSTAEHAVESAAPRRRRIPLGPIAAVLTLAAAAAGIVAWAPWSRLGNQQSVQTLASTSPGLASGIPAASSPDPQDTVKTPSVIGFAGDDTSQGDVPLTSQPVTPEATSIPDVRAPRAPRLPSDLNGSAAMQTTMNTSTSITISPAALAQNYESSYAAAQSDMAARLENIGFSNLFDSEKLASAGRLQEARRTLALAAATIREYRAKESEIEEAYRDTLKLVGQRLGLSAQELQGWDTRKSLKEAPGSARMVDDLLAQIDNIYGLIAGEEGRYEVNGSTIVFGNAESARRYGTLRTAITPRVSSWAKTDPAELPASLRPVIKAIGDTRPPVETT